MHNDNDTKTDIDQLFNLAYKLKDWINFYWRFYVVFIAIALGWVLGSNTKWTFDEKMVVTIVFIGFASFSITALSKTYKASQDIIGLLSERISDEKFKKSVLYLLDSKHWKKEILIHIIGDLILIRSIWFFN